MTAPLPKLMEFTGYLKACNCQSLQIRGAMATGGGCQPKCFDCGNEYHQVFHKFNEVSEVEAREQVIVERLLELRKDTNPITRTNAISDLIKELEMKE